MIYYALYVRDCQLAEVGFLISRSALSVNRFNYPVADPELDRFLGVHEIIE